MLESRPVRWKKYSFPSSAAMNPNPRSETSFLIVPVGIDKPPFSKACRERTGPFEKLRPRRTSPTTEGQAYLTIRFRGRPDESQTAKRATPKRVATAPES